MTHKLTELDLWRRALEHTSGAETWRGIRDLARTMGGSWPERVQQADGAELTQLNRRDLFKLLGASAALAGLTGCPSRPEQTIVPNGEPSPEARPGVPVGYATSMDLDGFATGLIAYSYDGRPVKIEGNPDHPASLGATSVHHQASVLDLYNPHRARSVRSDRMPSTWQLLLAELGRLQPRRPWFVMYPQSSPLIASLLERVRARFPDARFCFDAPNQRRSVYQAARTVFGRPLETQYHFDKAGRILSLDADFTSSMANSVRWARDFAARHRLREPGDEAGRLYVIEPALSPTGSLADNRLAVSSAEVAAVTASILISVADQGVAVPAAVLAACRRHATSRHQQWARAVARDLAAHRGEVLVIAGDRQPEITHVLAHALNHVLDASGTTTTFTEPALLDPLGENSLAQMVGELNDGASDTAFVLDANPVYTAPGRLDVSGALAHAPNSFHLSAYQNETSQSCRWLIPAAHYLEAWGDCRAYDGTLSFVQPLIRPLHNGRTAAEFLAAVAGPETMSAHRLLLDSARRRGLDANWRAHLKVGLIDGSAYPAVTATRDWAAAARVVAETPTRPRTTSSFDLVLDIDSSTHDGRFADNGWLQELPRPMTKLTWDNAAHLSPSSAVELGVATGSVIELEVEGRIVRAPVAVMPGHADHCVSLALGYGRDGEERLARGVGVNAYPLLAVGGERIVRGLTVRATARRHELAFSQDHSYEHGRDIALHHDLEAYRANPEFTEAHRGPLPSWLPEIFDYSDGPQWAMTIDTSICSGCSACVIACQAENNVPVVGKAQVERNREMHWLRIDRYFAGSVHDPIVINQPMMCQHCEKAPCEYVCPVNATTHSPDGLNEMTYNRCIGTRFCSNNCPYKVRRFNYFDWVPEESQVNLQKNPDVTVRARGVMEKCTYCVQRIRRAGIEARREDRPLDPNEVATACQQACPTGAIQFGSLNHEGTEMLAWRKQKRRYEVLHELGTRPRTVYLARIRNPNPEIP